MEIPISILLLTIAVLMYFAELKTVDGSGGPIRKFKRDERPIGYLEGGDLTMRRDPDKKPLTVFYGFIPIKVWLERTNRAVQKTYFPNCYIPQGEFLTRNSFLIRFANLQGTKLVAYVNQEGDLMGVQPLNLAGQEMPKPTSTEWYIHNCERQYRLFVNPHRKRVYEIEILSGNVIDPEQHSFERMTVAGIQFKVFKDTKGYISGAKLIQDYYYTVG